MSETIFALATAAGRGAVAIVRLSGPGTRAALAALTGAEPEPRRARRVAIRDPASGEILDDGIVLFFEGPASVTGEDVGELQLHGGRAVLEAIFGVLSRWPGFRIAEPGEFTRRAFFNGKVDLTEAEAVADLVAAETAAQRRQAMRQLGGELGRNCETWRQNLLRIQARIEAEIDFPDEDLPTGLWAEARREAAALRAAIAAHLGDGRRGERLRDGVAIAIVGPPNVGKSSLMNALARRDVAITAATAGTTRDVIEVALDLGGYPVVLADTAGLRPSADAIEEEGVRRARARAASADLRLVVLDASRPDDATDMRALIDARAILVVNKIDLIKETPVSWADSLAREKPVLLSVATGEGMGALLERMTSRVAALLECGSAPLVTRARHRAALERCVSALERFGDATAAELAAEDLRAAAHALGRITGRVDVEDLLDALFAEFCVGK